MLGGHAESTPTFGGMSSLGVGMATDGSRIGTSVDAPIAEDSGCRWAESSPIGWGGGGS